VLIENGIAIGIDVGSIGDNPDFDFDFDFDRAQSCCTAKT